MARTKIIATLGPASNSETILRKMFIAGLDVVRLNFSHGTHAGHSASVKIVRSLNKKMKRAIRIMQDLEGYRIRIGELARPLEFKRHSYIYLTQESIIGDNNEIPFDYIGPLKSIKSGTPVFIDDGKILGEVKAVHKNRLKVKMLVHGVLYRRKGMHIPGLKIAGDVLTDKDKRDVSFCIGNKLDLLAQSFVRNARDIDMLKGLVKPGNPGIKVYAKVENQDALSNIDEIIDASDGIIVARGDLGVCMPIFKVPIFQKEIIKKCALKKKPVVVATQMLDSMTEERIPTRAEVSDVANAILDGATHLLVSSETAVGRHPHKVIAMLSKIIKSTEGYQNKLKQLLM